MKRIAVAIALCVAWPAFSQTAWEEHTPALGEVEALPAGVLNKDELDRLIRIGQALFEAPMTINDGAGRPAASQAIIPTKLRRNARNAFARTSGPDANSCASCHHEPIVGGAGGFVTNVFVSEGFRHQDFDTTDPEFSNERGTNHLFGAGLIELLAREMTADLHNQRHAALKQARRSGASVAQPLITKDVSFGQITAHPDGTLDVTGIDGVDIDLVVRPFSQKGVMTSLRQFTVNAFNHHHGMQAVERFGPRWTAEIDFDEDGHTNEMTAGDVSALVAWQATLAPPIIISGLGAEWDAAAQRGSVAFSKLGCASCHRPSLPLEELTFHDPGPVDAAGTLNRSDVAEPAVYDLALMDWAARLPLNEDGHILVPLFGDLKRHEIADREVDGFGNELLSQRFVDRTVFMTSELWGIGSTAPYGHRNDMTTLDQAIRAHGGAGREARDGYVAATDTVRSDIIAYLKTMRIVE